MTERKKITLGDLTPLGRFTYGRMEHLLLVNECTGTVQVVVHHFSGGLIPSTCFPDTYRLETLAVAMNARGVVL